MKATYYKHNWVQEPDTRWFECHDCGELSAYSKQATQWVTVRPEGWTESCLVTTEWNAWEEEL